MIGLSLFTIYKPLTLKADNLLFSAFFYPLFTPCFENVHHQKHTLLDYQPFTKSKCTSYIYGLSEESS